MKTIFLSASIPYNKEGSNPDFLNSADNTAIRDAVLALVYVCLQLDIRIVWGGHPAITPIVYEAIRNYEEKRQASCERLPDEELKKDIQDHVHLFQSEWFAEQLPEDNNKFENITFTPKMEDIPQSLAVMREEMIQSTDPLAAVYIGGMEGVIEEDAIFTRLYPERTTYPIASTGGASALLYERKKDDPKCSSELLTNYAYTSLFYSKLTKI